MTNIEHSEDQKQHEALAESVKMNKIMIPVLIGIGVVAFLVWKTFDLEAFKQLTWNGTTILFFSLALLCYVIRHIAYSFRLRAASDYDFSFKKSIELIFIWEFASTVSPTSFGGSAAALFVLAQEKISAAKTVSIVIYCALLDTLYFLITVPLLVLIFGNVIVRPLTDANMSGFMVTLWIVYAVTMSYGLVLTLGIVKPSIISKLIDWMADKRLFKRFAKGMHKTATDLETTSKVLRDKPVGYHIRLLGFTFVSWIFRFLAVVFIIVGVVQHLDLSGLDYTILTGRTEMMHVITQFSPTPGGAGIAEVMFGGFYSDYIPKGVSTVIALIWRFITYYPYLFIGMIIIPAWLRGVMRRRQSEHK